MLKKPTHDQKFLSLSEGLRGYCCLFTQSNTESEKHLKTIE